MAERPDTPSVLEEGEEIRDEDLKQIKQAVKNVITSCYATLSSTVSGCLPNFAMEMLQAELITHYVMRSEHFGNIMQDYTAGIECICSYTGLVNYCLKLLGVLRSLGGPVELAANILQDKWNDVMKRKFGRCFIPQPREKRINSSPVVPSYQPPIKPSYSEFSKTCPSKMDTIHDEPSTDNSQSNNPIISDSTKKSTVSHRPSSHNLTMTRSSTSVTDGFVSGVENRKSLLSLDKHAEEDSGISPTTRGSQIPETIHSMCVSAPAEEPPDHPETTDNNDRNDDSGYLTVSMTVSPSITAGTTDNSHNHLSLSTEKLFLDKTANHDPETPSGDYHCIVTEESGNTPVHSNTNDNSKENTSSSHETEDSTNSNSQVEVSIPIITPPPRIVEVPCAVSQSSAQPAGHKLHGNTNERSIEPPLPSSQPIVECSHPVEESNQQHQSNPQTLFPNSNSSNHVPTQKPNGTPQDKSEQPQQDGLDEPRVTTPAVRDIVQSWVNNIFNTPSLHKSAIVMFDLTVLYVLSLPLQGLLYGSWCVFGNYVCFVILLILLLIYIIHRQ